MLTVANPMQDDTAAKGFNQEDGQGDEKADPPAKTAKDLMPLVKVLHSFDLFPDSQYIKNNTVHDEKSTRGGIYSLVAITILLAVLKSGAQELVSDSPAVSVSRHTVAARAAQSLEPATGLSLGACALFVACR